MGLSTISRAIKAGKYLCFISAFLLSASCHDPIDEKKPGSLNGKTILTQIPGIENNYQGVDLVLVIDNSGSMKARSSSYFTPPHEFPHNLMIAFDVFSEQIKAGVNLNVTLVTGVSSLYGYGRNYANNDKNTPHYFKYNPPNFNQIIQNNDDFPQTCIYPMNIHWTTNQTSDYSKGGSYQNQQLYDRPNFDKPTHIYQMDLIVDYLGRKLSSKDGKQRFNLVNCVVEPFASLLVLADLIHPTKELQVKEKVVSKNIFRKNTLKIFVVISDSFAPGAEDIADPVRTVLHNIVKSHHLKDTEALFKKQANTAFSQKNIRFYSFSTKGAKNSKKFARGKERIRQTDLSGTSADNEPTNCGRYYGNTYSRLASYYQGDRYDICGSQSQWQSNFKAMFKF
ncbi:MAG: hypothetical protein OXC40_07355 [Proteobacteria bacterium]|nr:hypothetical protein [Pseudomonadota bacterium]